jgi:ABC-type phosphate transport system permease subunit
MSLEIAGVSSIRPPEKRRRKRTRARSQEFGGGAQTLLAQGESMIWLTGGALVASLAMIVGLLVLIVGQGMGTFWPQAIVQIETKKGETFAGEVHRVDHFTPTEQNLADDLPPEAIDDARRALQATDGESRRRMIRTANFELTGSHFHWVSDFAIGEETTPEWMVVFERLEHGRFYGTPVGFLSEGEPVEASDAAEAWLLFNRHHAAARAAWRQRRRLETHDIGRTDTQEEAARLRVRKQELRYGEGSPQASQAKAELEDVREELATEREQLLARLDELRATGEKHQLLVQTAQGQQVALPLKEIVRAYPANQLTFPQKLGVYASRWWEFLSDDPRNVNTEGGVFPAIFGTVAMTLIMSLLVAPFGVLAALYLREYAKSGWIVSLVRIAINNLAGVPSIVFGVFGLGFFIYQVGTFIDGGPTHANIPVLPPPAWYLALGLLAVVAVGAFAAGIFGMSSRAAEADWRQRLFGRFSVVLWIAATALSVVLIAMSPFFDGFFRAALPNPTFGQGGILWAALTLSLLTLPVVIVATEEALAAVPNSMREGSYACGAGKWQTIRRIVLPHALPGIMTGMILAMSRGAGEAAPLMLVGALKFAPKLPIDGEAPFVHANRPFMHLAFHIFDLAFHSPNSEAAKPTVYTTALLLIMIVALLNIVAIWLRARLRKSFRAGQF